MPFYIATVYHLSSMVEAVEGDAGITRRVVRRQADDERDFEAQCRDDYLQDVDAMVEFGPISLSKDQETE